MIFHQFPDLQWLKQQSENRFSNRKGWEGRTLEQEGWPSVILNVRTGFTYRDNIRGPLSIFTNLSGESHVETGKNRTTIREGFFFISNSDQRYTLDINSRKTPTETFNIHFGEHFASRVLQSLALPTESLLNNHESFPAATEFHSRLNTKSNEMADVISFLHQHRPTGMLLDEKLSELMSILLVQENRLSKAQLQIPALKSSTREEIIKRLVLACDYIYTYYDKDLSLDELAAVACLSKFHFLRLFRIAFNKTPHQFINGVRIQRSKELLVRSTLDVKSISKAVGFDTSSSFSRMFRQQTGAYPSQFRA
jgi:AraC family transcriptional regulator